MLSRILALLVWAAVAASLAFWGLRWMARPAAVPPGTSSVALSGTAPRGDVTRLLSPPANAADEPSAPSQQAMLASRLQLVGVVAPRQGGGGGIALLVVDGKPARAFKTGHAIDGDLILQSVTQQGVQIGPSGGPAAVNLSLPLLPAAATGTLPGAAATGGMGAMNSGTHMGMAPAPMSGRPGGYTPPRGGTGGMADVPVEGAEPPAAGPGAGIDPGDLPPQQAGQMAAASPSPAAVAAAAAMAAKPMGRRWLRQRGNNGTETPAGGHPVVDQAL